MLLLLLLRVAEDKALPLPALATAKPNSVGARKLLPLGDRTGAETGAAAIDVIVMLRLLLLLLVS